MRISPRQQRLEAAVLGLTLAAALLLGVIAAVLWRNRRRLRRMEQSRETDQATGLGNQDHMARYFKMRLNDKNRVLYSMFFFYFDPMKLTGALGKEEADGYLQYMATVLQEFTSDMDILARMTDSGFAILRLCAGKRESVQWLEALLKRLRDFTRSDGTACVCPVTAGVFPLKAADRDLNEIVYQSLRAAKAAGQQGETHLFCSGKTMAAYAEEERLQADIGRGLEGGEFQIELQFYVDAGSGRIAGGQVLPSWEHPEKGLLPWEQFAPLMVQESQREKLDENSLEKACAFLDSLRQQGIEDFFLCCGLSEASLADEDFTQRCGEIVERYQFNRGRLILGLAERAIARSPEAAQRNIRALKELGLKLVLSDFGACTAGLFVLRDYPFDGLVLGGELVGRSGAAAGPVVLGSMIRMGHDLGIPVLAEGVETAEQAQMLRQQACDVMRGSRLYPTVPLWEARKMLKEHRRKGVGV